MATLFLVFLFAAVQEPPAPQAPASAWRTLPPMTGPGRYCTPSGGWSVDLGERDTAAARMAFIDEDRTAIRVQFELMGRRIEADESYGPLSEEPRAGLKIVSLRTPAPNREEYMALWEVPAPGGVEYRRIRSGTFNFGDYLVLRSAAFRGGSDDHWFLDRLHLFASRNDECMEGTRAYDYPEVTD